ncbi:MAG: PIN domain-containing protein [Deltaproteobacteria bacterium]|nr:PIN domain-containing protein [Deltaproteobacteria bacterium]
MNDRAFLDTNIFIYAIDTSPKEKKRRECARELIKQHIIYETGIISIQVLQEFFQVSTHKIKIPLSIEEALEFLQYISVLQVVRPDFNMITAAIRLHKNYSVSFWDAMILQSAKSAGCKFVLSEDLQDGLRLDGMVIKNPLKTQ